MHYTQYEAYSVFVLIQATFDSMLSIVCVCVWWWTGWGGGWLMTTTLNNDRELSLFYGCGHHCDKQPCLSVQ